MNVMIQRLKVLLQKYFCSIFRTYIEAFELWCMSCDVRWLVFWQGWRGVPAGVVSAVDLRAVHPSGDAGLLLESLLQEELHRQVLLRTSISRKNGGQPFGTLSMIDYYAGK